MLWEDNYLAHYGILKQRWGVRRFQNKDGSLTEEGRKRYLPPKDPKALRKVFRGMKDNVKKNLSNRYLDVERKPVNLNEVKRRGRLTDEEALECSALAGEIFEKARKAEPKITKDVVSVVDETGSKMYGLEYRLKQPTSIAAKIGQDAKEDDVSFKDAAGSIKDAIRYTSVSDDGKYVDSYFSIKELLEQKGYKEIRCKNYFDLYRKGMVNHKSVQCVYEDRDGHRFEIQFHTPESQAAKELKLPIYNERRKSGLSKERQAELENQMTTLAECVPDPKDINRIKSYS